MNIKQCDVQTFMAHNLVTLYDVRIYCVGIVWFVTKLSYWKISAVDIQIL